MILGISYVVFGIPDVVSGISNVIFGISYVDFGILRVIPRNPRTVVSCNTVALLFDIVYWTLLINIFLVA